VYTPGANSPAGDHPTLPGGGHLAHPDRPAVGERGNFLLTMTFKALRNVSLCPWTIGRIAAAALVLLHVDHGRTT